MNAALETPVEPVMAPVPSPIATAPVPAAPVSAAAASSIAYTYKRFPLTIVRGDGVTLFDDAGNSYLDCMSGIATNALGYNDAGVNAAIAEALSNGLIHLSNLVSNQPAGRVSLHHFSYVAHWSVVMKTFGP